MEDAPLRENAPPEAPPLPDAFLSESREPAAPGALLLSFEALSRLMPMHLATDADGRILSVGPTLARLLPDGQEAGADFFRLFRLRRPSCATEMAGIPVHSAGHLEVTLAGAGAGGPGLRGLAVPLPGGGVLMNLSFGIGVIEAVRQYGLTVEDFAQTDLAVELLYVVEAKTWVLEELRNLNLRLQGAWAEAEEQALTDTLTGLRNRRALEAELDALIRQGLPFSLMHLDLDYFKQVNDSLGHAAGDHVLRAVGRALIDETRTGDTVARVGGDEFVILLPRLCEADAVTQIAHRIIARLSVPMPWGEGVCQVSASIGAVLSCDYDAPMAAQMLADADGALYASKHAGRGIARLRRFSRRAGTPADGPE